MNRVHLIAHRKLKLDHVRYLLFVACPIPTTVFFTLLGAYSDTLRPNFLGTNKAIALAWASLSELTPSLLINVFSTAACVGCQVCSTSPLVK